MEIIKDKILVGLLSILIIVFAVFVFVFIKFNGSPNEKSDASDSKNSDIITEMKNNLEQSVQHDKTVFSLKDFYSDNGKLNNLVDSVFNSLNESERAGQVIVTAAGRGGNPYEKVEELIKARQIGGVLMLIGGKDEFKSRIISLSQTAKSSGSLPLIFSCDAEPSLINRKIQGSKNFPVTSEIKNENESYGIGDEIAKFIKFLGFHQNFAPVCDFNLNKEIIGNRSYGNNTKDVTILANAFIKAMQNNNIIATAKHFPGHGKVSGDSHKGLVTSKGDPAELETFKNVIDSGVICIMVGHIAVDESSKYFSNGKPATLSKTIVTDLLKGKLNFRGLVVTDAMNMEAVSRLEKPSLNALKSGCDMVIMPSDVKKLVDSIVELSKTDIEFKNKITESVKKIIRLKFCLNIL